MIDKERIEKAVRELLLSIGEDPAREGLLETPRRVADMYAEIFAGIDRDPTEHLKIFSEPGFDEMVTVRDIPLYSMCEHHLMPFFGSAHVVYVPKDGRILGISKIARIVDNFSKRPQVQERLTHKIADFIMKNLRPLGCGVVIEAEHLCMTMRGVRKPGSTTVTSALRGSLRSDARTRAEALDHMLGRRR